MFADHITFSEGLPWDQTETEIIYKIYLGPVPLAKLNQMTYC